MTLATLVSRLQQAIGILHKQDIQTVAAALGINSDSAAAANSLNHPLHSPHPENYRPLLGDDCTAIPDGTGYLLFASEGMLPQFVEQDPWFAGWSAVMVNVNDIYAMGGRPIAVVDTLWSQSAAQTAPFGQT